MKNKKIVHSIEQDFAVLNSDKIASIETCDSGLYQRLDGDYNGFRDCELISCHEFTQNWTSWEVHPKGDEIVMLLSGKITFVLQLEAGNESVTLEKTGEYLIVPKNVWHTAKTDEKSKVLFITPGEGTQNKNL